MYKKTISYILVFSMLFSLCLCFSANASAELGDGQFEISDLWDWYRRNVPSLLNDFLTTHSYYDSGCPSSPSGYHNWVMGLSYDGEYRCSYCDMEYRYYCSQAYDDTMEFQGLSDLCYGNDGGLYWYPTFLVLNSDSITVSGSNPFHFHSANSSISGLVVSYTDFPSSLSQVAFYYDIYNLSCYSDSPSDIQYADFSVTNSFVNSRFSFACYVYISKFIDVDFLLFYSVTPSDPSTAPPAQQVYTSISQIINIDFTVATIDQSQTITQVYQDITFFNPTTMIYYNPTLDLDFDVTSWIFDFDTRTYHLTLDDNTEVTLCFDDDRIIVFHGEDIYYYYYVSPTATEPTPEPSVEPTAEPTPRPTAPVGWPEDYDTDDTPMWNRLFAWLDDAKTWLGGKLDALLDKDTSVTLDPEFNIELPEVDPGFIYTDEAGEQQVWRPSALKDKFAFWKDVRDIGTELYASVQSENVSNGSSSPPELILHLGSANSNYGIDYGDDVYALDLSWYSEYKPTVDSITGGFLWLLYLYGVFKHLPEILSGVGMVDNRVEDIQSGSKGSRRRNQ